MGIIHSLEIVSALHRRHGAGVDLPAFRKVRDGGQDHDGDEDDDAPVEGGGVHRGPVGPQGPEKGKGDIDDAEHVDRHAPAAQAPAGRGQELGLEEAAVEDAADGDGVGGHERGDLQGDDGVEGDGGADVDEGEQTGEEAGEGDGVGGDVQPRVDAADPAGEREALVAREGEGLARRGRVEGDVAGDDEDEDHDGQRVDAAGRDGLLEDVDEGEAGRVADGVGDGRQAEEEGQQQDEAEDAVEHVGPEHGVGHVAPRVLDFFRHVRRRVGADRPVDGADLADTQRQAHVGPAAAVVELGEDDAGVVSGRENPQHDDDGEEAEDVDDEQDVLQQRQGPGAPDVGDEQNEHHGEDQEGPLPPPLQVGGAVVGVVDDDQRLDDGAGEKGSRRGAGLPRQSRHPSRHVAQPFLMSRWRKFRHPVILPAGDGGHGCHFGQGHHDDSEAEECPDVRPKQAGQTSVNESLGVCAASSGQFWSHWECIYRRIDQSSSYIKRNSQVAWRSTVKLKAESGRKFLMSSCCLPIRVMFRWSCLVCPSMPSTYSLGSAASSSMPSRLYLAGTSFEKAELASLPVARAVVGISIAATEIAAGGEGGGCQ